MFLNQLHSLAALLVARLYFPELRCVRGDSFHGHGDLTATMTPSYGTCSWCHHAFRWSSYHHALRIENLSSMPYGTERDKQLVFLGRVPGSSKSLAISTRR